VRVLLISTYELGHQPLHVASPAAALVQRGHEVTCFDLSVQPWEELGTLDGFDAVAISVPMHTAMRLGVRAARAVRAERGDLPICLYGLYAGTGREAVLGRVADRMIAGEYEPALVAWVEGLTANEPPAADLLRAGSGAAQVVHLQRGSFAVPARHLLPPLDRYARLALGGEERLVGYVEASHGCGFHCRHCPVPTIYDGRIRIVGVDTVLADVDQLVAAGARHITFGDPDFLNGAQHSRRVVAALHERHPQLTFDCTTKVELIIRHRDLWPELAAAGCLFVVSAFETVSDEILSILSKGHTVADEIAAIEILRAEGIEVRPSLLPFTPWTTLDDLVALVDFVAEHDLVDNVDPVHFSIRLLVPEGSLLLDQPAMAPHLGSYDPEHFSYTWTAADPRTDVLQARLAEIVEDAAGLGEQPAATYERVRAAVRGAAGLSLDEAAVVAQGHEDRPRLTEAWFCCAEPTELQFEPLPAS
jgi:radical SAM superfamily enzyme YgiQ (UPF0313 family)